jgi:hypothetical protein
MSFLDAEPPRRRARPVATSLVIALMAVGSLGLWTAIPLAWMLIAAWLSSSGYVAYLIALVGCVVTMVVWGWGLGRLNGVYDRLRGRSPDEGPIRWSPGVRREATLLDVMIVVSAVLALAIFLVWYLGFAGIPSGTPWPDETSGTGT